MFVATNDWTPSPIHIIPVPLFFFSFSSLLLFFYSCLQPVFVYVVMYTGCISPPWRYSNRRSLCWLGAQVGEWTPCRLCQIACRNQTSPAFELRRFWLAFTRFRSFPSQVLVTTKPHREKSALRETNPQEKYIYYYNCNQAGHFFLTPANWMRNIAFTFVDFLRLFSLSLFIFYLFIFLRSSRRSDRVGLQRIRCCVFIFYFFVNQGRTEPGSGFSPRFLPFFSPPGTSLDVAWPASGI